MNIALLAVVIGLPVSAAPVAPLIQNVPLPGYARGKDVRAPSRPSDAAFPSAEEMFGDSGDALGSFDSIVSADEDLHDAVAAQPAPTLQAALRSPSFAVRLAAVRAAAVPRAVSGIAYLSGEMLRIDEPARLRSAAALALGRIGDRVAVKALAEALKDPLPEVRSAAALSLGRLPADGVVTRLEAVLRGDPAWQPRYAAAIALGRTKKSFAALPLSDALTGDPAWQVRQQAARSLQDIGTEHAAASLTAALRDPEPSVRAAAGSALAEIGGPAQRQAVADALRVEKEPAVRSVLSLAARRAFSRP